MTAKGRTVEQIRDALRAELPAVRALEQRLAELYRELRATPEYRRRISLCEQDDVEAPCDDYFLLEPAWQLDMPLLGEPRGGKNNLRELAAEIERRTDPKAWNIDLARARRAHRRARRSRRASAKHVAYPSAARSIEDLSDGEREVARERLVRVQQDLARLDAILAAPPGTTAAALSQGPVQAPVAAA